MYCIKCGKEIPDDGNNICDECSKKSKRTLKKMDKIIIGTFIAIIFVTVLLGLIFVNSSSNTIGNSIGNIRNYGYAAKQGKWIYYLSPNEDSTQVGIFRVKENGKSNKLLYMSEKLDIMAINVYRNYVYFIGIETEDTENEGEEDVEVNNKIYRMRTNGSGLEVINDNEFSDDCFEIYVTNNYVYYIGINRNICKMKLDGSDKTDLTQSDTGFLGINENYILYNDYENENSTEYTTFIMNIDGTNPRPVISGKRLYNVNIEGDYVCYTDLEKTIYRTKIDSNSEEKIFETDAYNLNTSGEYAYYLNYTDESNETVCIYKVKLDGSSNEPEVVKKLDTYSSYIDVLGDWVLYMDSNTKEGFINLVNVNKNDQIIQLYHVSYEDLYNYIDDENTNTEDTNIETTDNESVENTDGSNTNTSSSEENNSEENKTTNNIENNVTNNI